MPIKSRHYWHFSLQRTCVPLYEYQCKKCKHRFEKIQKFSDAPVRKCPECGGPVEKLISQSSVQFKGSGWYVTDYARKGSGASESNTTSSDSAKDGAPSAAKTGTEKADKSEKSESKKSDKKVSKK
jgi:putative FmdB family regulatory protein